MFKNDMADTYIIKKAGDTFSPHLVENTVTGRIKSLCSCGGTSHTDGTCDGSHNKKRALGCACHFCKPKTQEDIA